MTTFSAQAGFLPCRGIGEYSFMKVFLREFWLVCWVGCVKPRAWPRKPPAQAATTPQFKPRSRSNSQARKNFKRRHNSHG